MAFEQDLMSALEQLFEQLDLVTSSKSMSLGNSLFRQRYKAIDALTHRAHSSIFALRRHFSKDSRASMEAVDGIVSYLLKSYTSVLNLQPYSPLRPFGVTFDPVKDQAIAENVLRMVAMNCSAVLAFQLHYALLMCAVDDAKDESVLLVEDTKKKLKEYLADMVDYLYAPGTAVAGQGAAVIRAMAPFIDTTTPALPADGANNDVTVFAEIRKYSFYWIQWMLTAFTDGYLRDTFKINDLWVHRCSKTVLTFNDTNHREVLQKKLQGDVDEYACLPYKTAGEGRIMQRVGSTLTVRPRYQVHVYKRRMALEVSDYKSLAMVHGEMSVLQDLVNLSYPVVHSNRLYVRDTVYPAQYLHLLALRTYTRSFLLSDRADIIGAQFREAVVNIQQYMKTHSTVDDKDATALQPMPDATREWLADIVRDLPATANIGALPTNGLHMRPNVINPGQVVTTRHLDPAYYNVTWHPILFPAIISQRNAYFRYNSVTMIHMCAALQHLPTPTAFATQVAFGSAANNLTVTVAQFQAQYGDNHIPDAALAGAAANLITFPSSRDLVDLISKKTNELCTEYKKHKKFLHPSSWLHDVTGWTQCETFELEQGTFLDIAPDAPQAATAADTELSNRVQRSGNRHNDQGDFDATDANHMQPAPPAAGAAGGAAPAYGGP